MESMNGEMEMRNYDAFLSNLPLQNNLFKVVP